MENEYIKSGMLFKKKGLGSILASITYNSPNRAKKMEKSDILFDIADSITGNIWSAYIAKCGIELGLRELQIFCGKNREELVDSINNTGYSAETKLLAVELLDKIIINLPSVNKTT